MMDVVIDGMYVACVSITHILLWTRNRLPEDNLIFTCFRCHKFPIGSYAVNIVGVDVARGQHRIVNP